MTVIKTINRISPTLLHNLQRPFPGPGSVAESHMACHISLRNSGTLKDTKDCQIPLPVGATQVRLLSLPPPPPPPPSRLEPPLAPAQALWETHCFPPGHVSPELGIWAGLLEGDESKKTFPALFLSEFESLSSPWSNPLIRWKEKLSLKEE